MWSPAATVVSRVCTVGTRVTKPHVVGSLACCPSASRLLSLVHPHLASEQLACIYSEYSALRYLQAHCRKLLLQKFRLASKLPVSIMTCKCLSCHGQIQRLHPRTHMMHLEPPNCSWQRNFASYEDGGDVWGTHCILQRAVQQGRG